MMVACCSLYVYIHALIVILYACTSFHVGSDASSAVFRDGIKKGLIVFQEASTIGYKLSILDIGGGFPGTTGSENFLQQLLDDIKEELENFVSVYPNTKIVSEPGMVLL